MFDRTRGANLNCKDAKGRTALMIAIQRGHFKIAELLIERNADIKHQDMDGNTALIYAIKNNGVDINQQNADGETPLALAKQNMCQQIIELLTKGTNLYEAHVRSAYESASESRLL